MRFNICFWKMTRPLQSYDRRQIIIEIVNRIVLHLLCLLQPKTCDHSTNESFQKAYLNPLIGHYYMPMYPEKPSSNQISLSHNAHSCSPHDPDPLERLVRVQCYVKRKIPPHAVHVYLCASVWFLLHLHLDRQTEFSTNTGCARARRGNGTTITFLTMLLLQPIGKAGAQMLWVIWVFAFFSVCPTTFHQLSDSSMCVWYRCTRKNAVQGYWTLTACLQQ